MKKTSIIIVFLTATVIIPFFIWGTQLEIFTNSLLENIGSRPYFCGMILTLLLASDIFLPIPSSVVSTACGMALGGILGTISSFLGMTISVILGYWIMRCGSPAIRKIISKEPLEKNRSLLWILVCRPIPVLAEVSILSAGLYNLPFKKVLMLSSIGNLLISALYAVLGSICTENSLFFIAFGIAMSISGILYFLGKRTKKQNLQTEKHAEND